MLELVSLLLAFNEVSTQAGMRRRGLLQSHASSAMYCVHMLRMRTLYCFLCTLRGLQVSCLAEWLRCPVQHFHDDVATLCVNCAGDVDHFQSEKSDSGWGCGWRNIQMVCSHLLRHDKVWYKIFPRSSLLLQCGAAACTLSCNNCLAMYVATNKS